ncbi:hypothetical protein KL909_005092 [Ogataea angusta]|nr:hypothetical protein KL909_005092 [Ogataea angusta]
MGVGKRTTLREAQGRLAGLEIGSAPAQAQDEGAAETEAGGPRTGARRGAGDDGAAQTRPHAEPAQAWGQDRGKGGDPAVWGRAEGRAVQKKPVRRSQTGYSK